MLGGSLLMGSVGWDLARASYANKSFHVTETGTKTRAVFINPDGTKMYVARPVAGGYDYVYQYTLSTPLDVSTASYDSKSYQPTQETSIRGIWFKPDGTKFYLTGDDVDKIFQYSLSTAWDISTASYDSKSLDVHSEDGLPAGLFMSSTGTRVYMIGDSNNTVYSYTLSTKWDISSGSYDSKSLAIGTQDGTPAGVFLNPGLNKLYISGRANGYLYQYTLSTAGDLTTGSYASKSLNVGTQDSLPSGFFITNNGKKIFLAGGTNSYIYQYSM